MPDIRCQMSEADENASRCRCVPDRGVLCLSHLTASRLRIMAREFERRGALITCNELNQLAARIEDRAE